MIAVMELGATQVQIANVTARIEQMGGRTHLSEGKERTVIEVHPHPSQALSDGGQSLKPEVFAQLMAELRAAAQAAGRGL